MFIRHVKSVEIIQRSLQPLVSHYRLQRIPVQHFTESSLSEVTNCGSSRPIHIPSATFAVGRTGRDDLR